MLTRRLVIVLCLLLVSLAAGTAQQRSTIDLRDWDPDRGGLRSLTGQWDFAWNALLSPDEDWTTVRVFELPATWNEYEINGLPLGGFGHATYRVRVLLPPGMTRGRLWMEPASTAYTLWANGELLSSMGVVGTSAESSVPYRAMRSPFFRTDDGVLDLTLQVSNYHHRVGGMWRPIWIGNADRIGAKDVLDTGYDILLLGICLCFALYNALIYGLGSKTSRAPLFLALFFLAVALRVPTLGSILYTRIAPEFSWSVIIGLEYLMNHAVIAFFALALHAAYPRVLMKHYGPVVAASMGFLSLVLFATGPADYSRFMNAFVLIAVLSLAWPLIRLTKVSFRGNRDARRGLLAIAVVLGIVVTEWAHYSELVISRDSLPFGFLLGVISSPPAAQTYGQILFNAVTILIVLVAATLLLFKVSEGLFGAATREAALSGKVSMKGCPDPDEVLRNYVNEQNRERLLNDAHTPAAETVPSSGLTEREAEIASLAAQGLSNKEIAAILFISEGTVRTHMYRIFRKTSSSNRTELSRFMLQG